MQILRVSDDNVVLARDERDERDEVILTGRQRAALRWGAGRADMGTVPDEPEASPLLA